MSVTTIGRAKWSPEVLTPPMYDVAQTRLYAVGIGYLEVAASSWVHSSAIQSVCFLWNEGRNGTDTGGGGDNN
jgi:hypothetical protein